MTIRGIAVLSSLVMAGVLAGCSLGTHSTSEPPAPVNKTDPARPEVDYAPNLSAPRTIGRVVTTVAGARRCIRLMTT